MNLNHLSEYEKIKEYQNQYLKQIKKYENLVRSGIFFRYYNINREKSIIEENTNTTYNNIKNNIYYDIYEYTPGFEINQLTNRFENTQDKGFIFNAELDVVIYTIEEPYINDLIIFPYSPQKSDQVLRVKNVETSIQNFDYIKYSRLSLVHIGVDNMDNLNINNHYVYMSNIGKNVPIELFSYLKKGIDIINSNIEIINNHYFDKKHELFFYFKNDKKLSYLKHNKEIYDIFKNKLSNNKFFNQFNLPYGILKYITSNNYNKILNLDDPYSIEEEPISELITGQVIDNFYNYQLQEDTIIEDTLNLILHFFDSIENE